MTTPSDSLAKATPRPWAHNEDGHRIESESEHGWTNDGWIIADCSGPDAGANATLIVTSVNGIDALKEENLRLREALKEGREAAAALASLMREGAHDKEEIKWCKVVDRTDAALGGEQK